MDVTNARRVVQNIDRPSPQDVSDFSILYTGLVADVMEKHGIMNRRIAAISPGMKACGPAVTSFGPDLTVRRMAIDLAQPGDVLVVAAGGTRDYACFGDGTAKRMAVKGMRGAIIDGCTRDAGGLRDLEFPTFAMGITPRNYHYPEAGDTGAVNVPVVCGGVWVQPGDLVLADDDGVVVTPRALVPSVLNEARRRLSGERLERSSWTAYPPFSVEQELRDRGYTFE